ncbi:hypothetical protein L0156_08760 [bacterium]|nr:hypothetical protein [bacterium]
MKYITVLIILFFSSLIALASEQPLSVEIVDSSDSVLLYSPVCLTGVIRNSSSRDVLVPVNEMWEKGWRFEVSRSNETLPSHDFGGDRGTDHMIFLRPGEKYFFSYNIGHYLVNEGVYEVRAVLNSSGRCLLNDAAKGKYQAVRLPENGPARFYQCWSGKIKSSSVTILVSKPVVREDMEALEFVRSKQFYKSIGLPQMMKPERPLETYDFSYAYDVLKERFPGSYYTYVAGLYKQRTAANGAVGILQELMTLQPNHPLSRYTKFELARWQQEYPMYPLMDVSTSGLSQALKEYIAQIKNDRDERAASSQ